MNNNNNFWESVKYFLVMLLIIEVFAFLIIIRANNTPKEEIERSSSNELLSVVKSELGLYMDKTLDESRKISEDIAEIKEVLKNNSIEKKTEYALPVRSDISASSSGFKIGEELPLPTLPTHIKTYTDYRYYNLRYTPHYRMQQSAYTDSDGLRRFNQDYIVALGAFYSTDIGDRFKVTLENGSEFTIILGDGKDPADCDPHNMYAPCIDYDGTNCANVLEFIIDSDVMAEDVYAYGSIDCINAFSGNIKKMVYLGRDNSDDWSTYE